MIFQKVSISFYNIYTVSYTQRMSENETKCAVTQLEWNGVNKATIV